MTSGPKLLLFSYFHSLFLALLIYWNFPCISFLILKLLLIISAVIGSTSKSYPSLPFLFLDHCFNWSHNSYARRIFQALKSKNSKAKTLNIAIKSVSLSYQMSFTLGRNVSFHIHSVHIPGHMWIYIFMFFFYSNRSILFTLFTQLSGFFSFTILLQSF